MASERTPMLSKHQNGQSLVEFALILPALVLVIAGVFDLGRAFYASITITNAAREGARFGTLNPDLSQGMCDAAWREAQSSGITLNYGSIILACTTAVTCQASATPGLACSEGLPLTVRVNYNYNDMIFKFFFPTGINLQRQVEMLLP